MDVEIVTRDGFAVMGVQMRCTPETAEFEEVWMRRFMPQHDRVAALATDKGYYGVWFGTEEKGMMDYLAGMAVEKGCRAPEGFAVRDVPGGRYAVAECTVGTIGETWEAVFGEWLPASACEYDGPRAGFEYYPPETAAQDSPVMIYLPVKEAAP
jgi:predicted transcriptional regulator YdeE